MTIANLQWQSAEQDSVRIEFEDGRVVQAPWPCVAWPREEIEAHLIEGGQILPSVEATVTTTEVDAERERRTSDGFMFNGAAYQSRPQDRENIAGAASAAHIALTLAGKQPGDLRWHGGTSDFVWITADNELVPMDAPAVIAFAQEAMRHKHGLIFKARGIKDQIEAGNPPGDVTDDDLWA